MFIVYDNPTLTLYRISFCSISVYQPPVRYLSRNTVGVPAVCLFQYWLFLQISPPEWRTDHYICLLGVCIEYHSPFLPQNIQILATVSCSRFIQGGHWHLRLLLLFSWRFYPCVCHLVLPPQDTQCVGNAENKEQGAVAKLSELCAVELVLKLNCPLDILKFMNYFIDEDSSKWCYCFRVLKKSHVP